MLGSGFSGIDLEVRNQIHSFGNTLLKRSNIRIHCPHWSSACYWRESLYVQPWLIICKLQGTITPKQLTLTI